MPSRWIRFVIIVLMMVPAGTVQALDSGSGLPGGNAGQGIPAGNFVIYPTLELIYQYEDNLFLTPSYVRRVKSASYAVRPKIMVEMPFLTSYFRVGYAGEYREYDEYAMRDNWTHTAIADLRLILSSGMTVTAQDRYMRTTLYTEAFDKNREVVWGRQPFVSNTMVLQVRQRVKRQLAVVGGGAFTTVRFDEPATASEPIAFFDYTTRRAYLGMDLEISPLTKFEISASRTWVEQDRSAQGLDEERKSTAEAIQASLGEGLTPTLSGKISVGYRRSHYDQFQTAGQASAGQGQYRGLVYGLQLNNRFSPKTTAVANFSRAENQSSFLGSNYYVSATGMLTVTQNLSQVTFWSLGISYQQNSYPALSTEFPGERRDDDTSGVKVGVGMYFLERGSARFNYTYQDRDSSIGAYSYVSNRYTVQVQVGW
ncbi:MAG: outer membrane beta-barrel protein [Acidobacteriota bacterium]|nr:MAG: outer membrane beta-barrel protein [Acidobacteriota bacterium]